MRRANWGQRFTVLRDRLTSRDTKARSSGYTCFMAKPLSWTEIRNRAYAFSREYAGDSKENAEAQTFWNDFFLVFGISRRRVASYERAAVKQDGSRGRIDGLWPGVMLIEHKSRGASLDKAEGQAVGYLTGLKDAELPRYILVSDFAEFRLDDLVTDDHTTFRLDELPDRIRLFDFVAGYEHHVIREQDPVNEKAAVKMGELHDALTDSGYGAPDLDRFLVRLLFCLFADDTGIFIKDTFDYYLRNRTAEDGRDLGMHLDQIFQILDTPGDARQRTLDEDLAAFPYVNGGLFEGRLRTPTFDSSMREVMLEVSALAWGGVSPAIFGSMFQAAMDPKERRDLGAHYTSEENILKVLGPLFLDALRSDATRVLNTGRGVTGRAGRTELDRALTQLASYRFLDPACGSGNFLIVAYRELRRIELELVHESLRRSGVRMDALEESSLNVRQFLRCSVDQFYGIEIDGFAARVAETAMWLVDHQMNREASQRFGELIARIPIEATPHIVHANSLAIDWGAAFAKTQPERFDFILGNPPFIGAKYQTDQQRADLKPVRRGIRSGGLLDYVTGWFIKAARYVAEHPRTTVGFVSTNSIAQGEQAGVLWSPLYDAGMQVHFAHQTFRWSNLAKGNAAVHVVIVGFGLAKEGRKDLYTYDDIASDALCSWVPNINPYLMPGPDVTILRRRTPWPGIPAMGIGNKPIDGGNYLFTPEEKAAFLEHEPQAAPYFRRWYGSREFLNGIERWCLWLGDANPAALRAMPLALQRVEAVKAFRLASDSKPTQKLAATPRRFHVENFPATEYLIVPKVSSERRAYIPVGFADAADLASDLVFVVPTADRYHFGILSSAMHMGWMRYTAGRLKSDYRYSATLVYNNYPWPSPVSAQKRPIELAAQAVLDARKPFLEDGNTLADLYDPLTMPGVLAKAHKILDKAVDLAYRPQPFPDERRRVEWLFGLWGKLASVDK